MASKTGAHNFSFILSRDKCCRGCGMPAVLWRCLAADHISPEKKIEYAERPADIPPWYLQVLCFACNNAKGKTEVPALPIREPEFDVHQIALNQERFTEWVDEHRPPSTRRMARLAKRK